MCCVYGRTLPSTMDVLSQLNHYVYKDTSSDFARIMIQRLSQQTMCIFFVKRQLYNYPHACKVSLPCINKKYVNPSTTTCMT